MQWCVANGYSKNVSLSRIKHQLTLSILEMRLVVTRSLPHRKTRWGTGGVGRSRCSANKGVNRRCQPPWIRRIKKRFRTNWQRRKAATGGSEKLHSASGCGRALSASRYIEGYWEMHTRRRPPRRKSTPIKVTSNAYIGMLQSSETKVKGRMAPAKVGRREGGDQTGGRLQVIPWGISWWGSLTHEYSVHFKCDMT